MLVYYCATSFENIVVINGHSKGTLLYEIHSYNQGDIKHLTRNEVFLDNATGDYYTYKKELDLWVPVGNVGLHYLKSSESLGSEGAFMRKVKTYRPKPSKYSTQEVIKSKITERKCKIKKEYLHHWLVQNIEPEFVAINESLWDPHPIGLSTTSAYEVNYSTIAESDRGPEVIEHRNTIAMQIHIESKYEPTIKLINNFINKKFELITEMSRADMTLDEAENYMRGMMYTKGPHAAKFSKKENFEVKTRGKTMFVNKN